MLSAVGVFCPEDREGGNAPLNNQIKEARPRRKACADNLQNRALRSLKCRRAKKSLEEMGLHKKCKDMERMEVEMEEIGTYVQVTTFPKFVKSLISLSEKCFPSS